MNREQTIEAIKQMIQVAGTERIRALFQKYNLKGVSPNVTGVITGLELYKTPFAQDFYAIVVDASRAKAKYDDYGIPEGPTSSYEPTSGGFDWSNIFDNFGNWLTGAASVISATNGNPYVATTAGASGTPTIIMPSQSSSSSNTAIIIVVVVVVVLVGALIAFMALKKK
jgi:hypothetical protein